MKTITDENKPIMIFKYEEPTFTAYSCCISSKQFDGTYKKAYMPVIFPKSKSVENKAFIHVKDGFLTAVGREGYEKVALFVKDFEVV